MTTGHTSPELPAPSFQGADYLMSALTVEVRASARMNRILEAQVEAAPADQTVTGVGIHLHSDSCKTMRRNIFLARLCALPAGTLRADHGERRRKLARARIIRGVEDAIHGKVDDGDDAESLREELFDRMDASDLEDEIETLSPDEIVLSICRDLGLGDRAPGAPLWKRRTPEDVAFLNAKAAAAAGEIVAAPFTLSGPARVMEPKVRPPRDPWWDLPDPDKPLAKWTDAELDRAEARERQDSG